jgi:hypothetical protein
MNDKVGVDISALDVSATGGLSSVSGSPFATSSAGAAPYRSAGIPDHDPVRLTAAFELLTGGLPLPHPGNV